MVARVWHVVIQLEDGLLEGICVETTIHGSVLLVIDGLVVFTSNLRCSVGKPLMIASDVNSMPLAISSQISS